MAKMVGYLLAFAAFPVLGFPVMRWRKSIIALASICFMWGCQEPKEPDAEQQPAASGRPSASPALPAVQPVMDREALLLAVIHAASEAAIGRNDEEAQRRLDGGRFQLRMRFGCDAAAVGDQGGSRGWTFDEKRRVLSLTVEPEIADDLPLVRSLKGEDYEAVEGFWFHRPWLLKAACPATLASGRDEKDAPSSDQPVSKVVSPSPRIGIAQFFTATDPRTHRRDNRAYKATKVLAEGQTPGDKGYDLVISGRLRRLTDGRVIACRSENSAAPPSCIISARFDDVAIELPSTGETIAKWSGA